MSKEFDELVKKHGQPDFMIGIGYVREYVTQLQTELEKERTKCSELIILKNDYKISIMKLLLDDKEERERLSIILNAPNEATKKAIIKRKENEPR
jgi:hypothetical protein